MNVVIAGVMAPVEMGYNFRTEFSFLFSLFFLFVCSFVVVAV